jgi:predicted dithiol-disulfide oxidoreductase (DUF899 family)
MPAVVSQQEWQAARKALLAKEKELTRAMDALAAERRRLPMVRFGEYRFAGPGGTASLLDLFEGRRQLAVYQFMDNGPDDFCSGCASYTDSVPATLAHLHARNTGYVCVSDMPLPQLTSFWQRMGWTVPYYSSRGTTFAADCGGAFSLNVFLRDGDDVYRTYSTTGRGVDRLRFDSNILDLTPYGRQEEWEDSPEGTPQTPLGWWRLHDEYPDPH